MVSAFETVDDATLVRLDKGHTAADMVDAVAILRDSGIEVRPSWMPFTPWTTLEEVQGIVEFVARHDLVANVDPIQYAIRLLLPPGSLLLEHRDLEPYLGAYDADRGSYAWWSADPAMDELQARLAALVEAHVAHEIDPLQTYAAIRETCALEPADVSMPRVERPHLSEPWFCCAEPSEAQLAPLASGVSRPRTPAS